ncbi:MAG: response regulator [Pseudomonadota bacterium]
MNERTDAPSILVVDDDPDIRELTAEFLDRNSMHAFTASNTTDADKLLADRRIDLIVLDLMMPGEDGRAYFHRIRKDSMIPIIMLTALGDDIDRIIGLEMGADDYLAKPFQPRELVARIKSVLRRAPWSTSDDSRSPTERYDFDGYTLDVDQRQLRRDDGSFVDLTSGEFALLLTLVQHRPRVLSRDQLLDLTRGAAANPYDRSIDSQISRLRRKIEPDPRRAQYIKTVRNIGYAFAGVVRSSDQRVEV